MAESTFTAPETAWMVCETRGPWMKNSLRARAKEMRASETRSRKAFLKPYMGEPMAYLADAYAEAAALFGARLAAIDSAILA